MFSKLKRHIRTGAAVVLGVILSCSFPASRALAADVATDAIPGWPAGPTPIYGDTAVLMIKGWMRYDIRPVSPKS